MLWSDAKARAERELQAERASTLATKAWRAYLPAGDSDYLAWLADSLKATRR